MDVNATIFKAYDIRGVVGTTLTEALAEHLGRAFGTEALALGEKAVAVGRDGRLSGPALVSALTRGLLATGVDVIDIEGVYSDWFAQHEIAHLVVRPDFYVAFTAKDRTELDERFDVIAKSVLTTDTVAA